MNERVDKVGRGGRLERTLRLPSFPRNHRKLAKAPNTAIRKVLLYSCKSSGLLDPCIQKQALRIVTLLFRQRATVTRSGSTTPATLFTICSPHQFFVPSNQNRVAVVICHAFATGRLLKQKHRFHPFCDSVLLRQTAVAALGTVMWC